MPVTKIVESLNKLSVLELVELKKALESEWDVTAAVAAPVAVAAPAAGGGKVLRRALRRTFSRRGALQHR